MSNHLIEILERSLNPTIFVVGDVILDRYHWGNVDRISPEAPIPLLRVDRREQRLGGAGSVVSMLAALDVNVRLATVLGNDDAAVRVYELLEDLGVATSAVLTDDNRPTTVKERFLGRAQSRHPQQMIRIDHEEDSPLETSLSEQMIKQITSHLDGVDVVLVSDYNKGVCAGDMIPSIVAAAEKQNIPVIADPIRGGDYRRYAGCACITPNRLEASLALGRKIETPDEGIEAAQSLLDFGVHSAIVTLDRDGMAWARRDGSHGISPIKPREVYDITGAGDMVLSIIGYSVAAGLEDAQIVELANLAGGLEVERLGVVPLTRDDLLAELHIGEPIRHLKALSCEDVQVELQKRRQKGQRIVMTNGCFDLIHPGHVASLLEARALGDCLVVGLNSDVSVRQLKGEQRPVINEQGRAAMLTALECVDYVVLFDEVSVEPLVQRIMPDVLAKAAQYAPHQVVGYQIVQANGGEVVCTKMHDEYSTTSIIEGIQRLAAELATDNSN